MYNIYAAYHICYNKCNLYGWSDNKRKTNEFISIREPLKFIYKELLIPNEEYEDFINKYGFKNISYKHVRKHNTTDTVEILITDDELISLESYLNHLIYNVIETADVSLFLNNEVLNNLDKIGYIYFKSALYDYDDDLASYQLAYNMSPLGNPFNYDFDILNLLSRYILDGGIDV